MQYFVYILVGSYRVFFVDTISYRVFMTLVVRWSADSRVVLLVAG